MSINSCKFLIDAQQKQSLLEDTGEYYQMSAERLAEVLLPYVETTSMVYEAINLKSEWKNDKANWLNLVLAQKIKACLCLWKGNYIISKKIELQWAKLENQEDDSDMEDFQWVY